MLVNQAPDCPLLCSTNMLFDGLLNLYYLLTISGVCIAITRIRQISVSKCTVININNMIISNNKLQFEQVESDKRFSMMLSIFTNDA